MLQIFFLIYTTTTTASAFYSSLFCLSYDFHNNCYFSINNVENDLSKLCGISDIGTNEVSADFLYNLKSFLAYPFF